LVVVIIVVVVVVVADVVADVPISLSTSTCPELNLPPIIYLIIIVVPDPLFVSPLVFSHVCYCCDFYNIFSQFVF